MIKSLLIILTIIFSLNIQAQHTEKFLELSKSLKAIDSSTVIRKYSNGNTKEITKYLKYEYGDYTYEFISGFNRLYLKNGKMISELEYDKFGNILTEKGFNKEGEIYRLVETVLIDTKSESLNDCLNSDRNLIISQETYLLSDGGELFLWQKGKKLGKKKIGIWKTYNQCDESVKLKDYTKK